MFKISKEIIKIFERKINYEGKYKNELEKINSLETLNEIQLLLDDCKTQKEVNIIGDNLNLDMNFLLNYNYKDYEKKDEFKFRKNQLDAINNTINTDFNSGIHYQATGAGKSIIILKIISEFTNKYPNSNIFIICERKDVLEKLFFIRDNKKINFNYNNFEKWNRQDIIDMNQYNIIDGVNRQCFSNSKNNIKKRSWNKIIKKINNNSKKSKLVIINRCYITYKDKNDNDDFIRRFQLISDKEAPKLIIIDECHSISGSNTYEFLLYAKQNWNSKIIGFSATPYREGKTLNKYLSDVIETDEEYKQNYDKILNIFGDKKKLNIISKFTFQQAIEENIILEPIFIWYDINNLSNTTDYDDEESNYEIINILDKNICNIYYKKGIIWTGKISKCEDWYNILKEQKLKYKNLKKIKIYKDHSSIEESKYENFYNKQKNSIIVCANKYVEGSDIPNLDFCVFLDGVKKRGELTFIQKIGRVLRKDETGKKKNGYIFEGYVTDNSANHAKNIALKIIGYYVIINDLELGNIDKLKSKNNLYKLENALRNIEIETEKQIIKIKLNNDKKIIIKIDNLEWNNFTEIFKDEFNRIFEINKDKEFIMLINRLKENYNLDKLNLNYDKKYEKICEKEDNELLFPKNIKMKYSKEFDEKSWYDILDNRKLFYSKNELYDNLIKLVDENKINIDDFTINEYKKIIKEDKKFPKMINEFTTNKNFIKEFTNYYNEKKKKQRKFF